MTNKIIEELKKRFCRKNAQTGQYEPRWFVEDATTYQDIEDFFIEAIEEAEDEGYKQGVKDEIETFKKYEQTKDN